MDVTAEQPQTQAADNAVEEMGAVQLSSEGEASAASPFAAPAQFPTYHELYSTLPPLAEPSAVQLLKQKGVVGMVRVASRGCAARGLRRTSSSQRMPSVDLDVQR
jgi:hypothetical protein